MISLPDEARRLQSVRAAVAHLAQHPDHEALLASLGRRLPRVGSNPLQVDTCTETVISGRCDFTLSNLHLKGLRNGIILHACKRFRISNVRAEQLLGCAITLFDCEDFEIAGVHASECYSSAVMCVGNTKYGRIHRVTAVDGRGPRNRDAAVHLVSCTPNVQLEDVPDRCHEARSIAAKVKRPSFITIDRLSARRHRAQGVYLEGAVGIDITRSSLIENNKEGICFDWGTSLCRLSYSTVARNGYRRDLSKEDIDADFLHHVPILVDGSSAIKVPGVSLDNAAFNRIERNLVYGNGGGAFKLVRACTSTVIKKNLTLRNTGGNNEHHQAEWYSDVGAGDPLQEFGEAPLLDLGRSFSSKRRLNASFEQRPAARLGSP